MRQVRLTFPKMQLSFTLEYDVVKKIKEKFEGMKGQIAFSELVNSILREYFKLK